MSAILNIVEGMKQIEEERMEREANIKNEREKAERELAEQQAQAETPEVLQEQLDALNKAIADVTAKLHKGENK